MSTTARELSKQQQLGLRLGGAALLAATGAIHLDLYLTGYSSLSVIGPLFLLQVIAAFGLALAVLVLGRPPGGQLAAAAGAGFAVATLIGYLLSVWIGLFGFREIRTTAGIVAGIIEIAAFAILAVLASAAAAPGRPAGSAGPAAGGALLARLQAGVPGAGRAIAAVAVVALIALGVALAGAGAPAPASSAAGGGLHSTKIGGVAVLTNAKGFTLYWFVPDTRTKSNCNGSCAGYWPPVKAPVTAGSGVTGKIGAIKRADGSSQATYNGRPLYTYIGDDKPGQARGNNINLNGGVWHEVTISG